jgi:arsenate reductase (glutaredoxin)
MDIVIYHNPACGTSRNTLAMIQAAGFEPLVIDYLKSPPSRETLSALATSTGNPLRALLREKDTPYATLGLSDTALSDDQILDAIAAHPILLNRPIVVSPAGTRLCRPSEAVLALLPPMTGSFTKEDGEVVDLSVRP